MRLRARSLGMLVLLVAVVALVGASAAVAAGNAGRVMPGVRIGGVALGGLTRDAAEERLRGALPSLTDGAATVMVDGVATVIPYEQIGRGYEWDAMLDAAFAVARDGNLLSDGVARLVSLVRTSELPILVHGYEPDAIDRAVAGLVTRFAQPPVPASVHYDPTVGFSAIPGRAGRALDTAEVRRALGDAMATTNPADLTITLATHPVQPRLTTAIAQQAAAAARAMSAAPLAIAGDDAASGEIAAAEIAAAVRFGVRRDGSFGAWADIDAVRDALASQADAFSAPARNAGYTFDAAGVTGVVPAVDGRSLSLTRTALAVLGALERRAAGASVSSVDAEYDLLPALLSTAAAETAAPHLERLSTWTTYYKPGIGNANGANISIPAQDVNGLVLAPGEWFDFWKRIGPVTLERGYGYGGAIIDGRSTPNGVLAGGICSTSTTLFNAALRGGLEMGERYNHFYYIARYPVGLDATVIAYDTWAASMTFRNDTPDPIVIRAYTGSGYVRFDIWGVSAGRTVSLSEPIITNRVAARETTRYNPRLAPGTSVRIEGAYNGFDASVTRTVRDADGTVIHVDTWFSHYNVVNGITEVGPALPTPPPTPSPTPEPTPAPSPT
jgi:vancomycin resistance protein YoaR